jgi:uncharacterized repeat protein (TIGR01451 family)
MSLSIDGGFVYGVGGYAGLSVVDISDAYNLRRVINVPVPGNNAGQVIVSGGKIYVGGGDNVITVLTQNTLVLSLTASPPSAPRGSNITYTLNVSNPSTSRFENVNISLPIPAGTTYQYSDNGGTPDGASNVVWAGKTFERGTNQNLILVVKVN